MEHKLITQSPFSFFSSLYLHIMPVVILCKKKLCVFGKVRDSFKSNQHELTIYNSFIP